MQISYDESLLSHEQVFSRFRGLHTGQTFDYERGNVRSAQAAVVFGHMIERAYRDAEAQAAADSEPQPQAAGLGVLGTAIQGVNPQL